MKNKSDTIVNERGKIVKKVDYSTIVLFRLIANFLLWISGMGFMSMFIVPQQTEKELIIKTFIVAVLFAFGFVIHFYCDDKLRGKR